MHDLNTIAVPKISGVWADVAYALCYDISTVKQIRSRHNENPTRCCKELFEDWLSTSNGATPKIWQTLLDKLKELKEVDAPTLIEEIKEKLFRK